MHPKWTRTHVAGRHTRCGYTVFKRSQSCVHSTKGVEGWLTAESRYTRRKPRLFRLDGSWVTGRRRIGSVINGRQTNPTEAPLNKWAYKKSYVYKIIQTQVIELMCIIYLGLNISIKPVSQEQVFYIKAKHADCLCSVESARKGREGKRENVKGCRQQKEAGGKKQCQHSLFVAHILYM